MELQIVRCIRKSSKFMQIFQNKLCLTILRNKFVIFSIKLTWKLDSGFTDCIHFPLWDIRFKIWESLLYRGVILRQWCVQCRIFLWERSLERFLPPSPPRLLAFIRIARKQSNATLLNLGKDKKWKEKVKISENFHHKICGISIFTTGKQFPQHATILWLQLLYVRHHLFLGNNYR